MVSLVIVNFVVVVAVVIAADIDAVVAAVVACAWLIRRAIWNIFCFCLFVWAHRLIKPIVCLKLIFCSCSIAKYGVFLPTRQKI